MSNLDLNSIKRNMLYRMNVFLFRLYNLSLDLHRLLTPFCIDYNPFFRINYDDPRCEVEPWRYKGL